MILRQLRLTVFHVKEFVKVPYFISVMIVSTLSILATQALAHYAWGGDPWVAWVRSGIVGMWSTTTVAAGILGFERFKGTLVHLVLARVNVLQPLMAVVSAAASFGLLSFPVAFIGWRAIWLAGDVGWGIPPLSLAQFIGVVVFLWISCLACSFVIACFFVLTPNAIVYEELLLIPIFILSGLVFTSTQEPSLLAFAGQLVPISAPSRILLGTVGPADVTRVVLIGALVTAAWILAAYGLSKVALRRARVTGSLQVI